MRVHDTIVSRLPFDWKFTDIRTTKTAKSSITSLFDFFGIFIINKHNTIRHKTSFPSDFVQHVRSVVVSIVIV